MRILRRLSATFLTMLLLFNATACQMPQGLMPGLNTSNSEEVEHSHDHSHDHSGEVHEHTFYSHWSYDSSYHWHDASCDHNVRDSYTTHTFSDWKVILEPTDMYNGIKEKVCSVCNYSLREVISGHTHSPIDGKYSQSNPTCEKDGYKEYDCSCGEHIKETLPSLGHDIDVYYGYNDETHFSVEKCIRCDFYKESKAEKHSLDEKIVSEATEFIDGLKIVYCYVCGYEKEVVIPSLGHIHDYEYSVVKVDATCQNEGYTRHSCICGDYYDSDIVEKQHSYYSYYDYTPDYHWLSYHCNYCDDKYMDMEESHKFEMSVVREPTEKQDGIYRYSCICGYEYDEIIPSAVCEHDYFPEFNWSNNNGQVELEIKFFCTKNPNHILEEGNYDYGYQLWAWIYEPTCISTGLATYRGEAIYDGKTYYDYADMELAADPSYHHYEETVIPPTCEDKGYTIYTCKDCGYSYKDNYVASVGHSGQYSVCFDDLYHYDYFECDVCGYTDMYNPKKHNFETQYGHDDINFEHWFVDICSDCGYSQIRDKIMHQFVEEVIVAPTEESEGLVRYTCYCGYSYEEVLPMLNHTHDYQPIFTWYPNFAPELDVSFVCSKDPSHVLDSSEYTYGFDVLEFINPTCMQEGYISYHGYATYNGVTYTEYASFVLPVDTMYHDYNYETIVVDPTCEEQGYTIHRCICGLEYIDNYIDAKGHEYNGAFSYDENQHWEFAICGHDANINYGPHEFNYEVIKEPTEYEEGEGLASCWCLYSYSYVIPPLGHTHVYSRIETIYPTCETQGYTRYTCECGDSYESDYVDALGHDYQAIFNWYPNSAPLMEVTLICTHDSSHQVQSWELMTGWVTLERNEPTCLDEGFERLKGYVTYGELYFEEEFSYALSAYGHVTDSSISYDETNHWTHDTCLNCGQVFDYNYTTHTYSVYVEQEATEEVEGLCRYECDYCDYMYYESIPTLQHSHDYNYDVETFAASCTKDGYTRYTCRCGDYFDTDYVYAYGHNNVDGYCSVCGILIPSEGLEYSLINGVEYSVIGIGTCIDDVIIIPNEYNGLPVTSIGDDAFVNATNIRGFIVSDGVETIGENAFGYQLFDFAYIPSSVTSIEVLSSLSWIPVFLQSSDRSVYENVHQESFYYGVDLKDVIITDSNVYVYYDGVLTLASGNKKAKSTSYEDFNLNGEQVKAIGPYAYHVSSLVTADLNNGIESISSYAFNMCYELKLFGIPESVTHVGNCIVYTGMTEVHVACVSQEKPSTWSDSWYDPYSSIYIAWGVYANDIYYDDDIAIANNHIMKYHRAGIADFTKPIEIYPGYELTEYTYSDRVFYGNNLVTEVILPEGHKVINSNTFSGCSSLVSVVLPSTIDKIETYSLPSSLEYIYYAGSEEQWNEIEGIEKVNSSVSIVFNYGNVHEHSYTIEVIEPTCEQQGYTRYTCECGDSYESDYVDALGHDYVAVYSFFPNTDDLLDIVLVCQNDKSHQVNEDEMDSGYYVIERIEPTCTETGFERIMGYANYNGLHFEDEFSYYPNAFGHNYEYNVEVVEATCEENGYTRYTCECGDYFDSDYVYATGHNKVDGYCSVCGILVPSEGLEYSFNGIGYSVSGLGTCKDSKVVIPEYYNGYPVTSILRGAIHTDNYDTSFINEIILPSTLVTIESSAISASNMRHIMVPESVINYEWDSIYDYSSWPQNTIICFKGKAPESVYGLYIENIARDYVKEVIYENNKQYIITNENYAILSRIYDGDISIPSEINGYPVTTLGSYVFKFSTVTSFDLLDYNFTTLEGMCLDGLHYAGIKGTENFENELGFGLIKDNFYCDEVIITVQENSIPSDWGSYVFGYPSAFIKVVYNATLGDLVELEDGSVYAYNNGVYTLVSYDFGEEADLTKELVLSDGTILSNYHVAEGLINCNIDLKKVILNNTVSTITEYMFAGNIKLESVVLSPSVTKIDSYAFDNIDTLKSISFNGQCGLKEIGDSAFNECINLTSADIFTDIVSIGDYAFYHTGITYFSPSYDIEYIGEYAFAKSKLVEVQFGLQDSLKEIGKYAFAHCYDMQYFHMADLSTLEVIPEYMCYYNSALISVILSNSVIEIGTYAFDNCSNIKRLDISSNLVTMGYGVFSSLKGLEGLVLPSSLDASLLFGNEFGTNSIFKIDGPVNLELYDKFASCNNVVCFTDSDYDRASDAVFEFIVYDDSAIIVSYPQGSKEDYFLTIPDIVEHNGKTYTVKYINPYMFLDYCNFSSVKIPDGIIYIGREAFHNNTSLTEVTLPSSLKYISSCFNNISEITIPDNIEYMSDIGSYEVTYHISSTFDKDISSIIDQEYNKINYVIDGDNERFELVDGVLVDVELNKIVSGCNSNNIPKGYTTIGDSAYSCLSFSEVIIPEGVEKIDYYAFYGCYNIDKVVIPSTIKEIHTQAFEMALFNENLQIIFNGTKDDFVTIFSEGINNVEYETFWLSYLYCNGMDDYTNVSCIDGILTLKMRGV